jgi:TRAP-type uncharacterized transport system substrate-binding protein
MGVYKAKNSSSSMTLEVGTALYPELLHLICNSEAGLSKITGLTKTTPIMIGPNGSGTSVTWDSFVNSDPSRYGVVPTLPIGGIRALGRVKEGTEASCMLFVTGLKASSINEANVVAKSSSGKLVLVPTNDSDLLKLKSPGKNGKVIYEEALIPSGTYPGGLQPASIMGSSVKTISVNALFVTNTDYIDAHPNDYDSLLRSVNRAIPAVHNRVMPKD